jgi:hypothetical protein
MISARVGRRSRGVVRARVHARDHWRLKRFHYNPSQRHHQVPGVDRGPSRWQKNRAGKKGLVIDRVELLYYLTGSAGPDGSTQGDPLSRRSHAATAHPEVVYMTTNISSIVVGGENRTQGVYVYQYDIPLRLELVTEYSSTQRPWEIRSEYSEDLDSSPSHIREQKMEKRTNRTVWAIT